ncbi:hypothetical protein [Saccharothrix luteola]|uniref:hypothetical protein n=1 Tax=Saccharothrix luteola TaxID=2893018 RepID=UPI001E2FEFAB|nr:hypothetical protein [Saccharothrix luteola]MCC8251599.1 hypothetical protein [Saccharothrix luteola]
MSTSKWRVVPSDLVAQWLEVFDAAWSQSSVRVGGVCPNCHERALHHFYIRHKMLNEWQSSSTFEGEREGVHRQKDAADSIEWCAHCNIYNYVKDQGAPPRWPETFVGVENGGNHTVASVIDAVMNHIVKYGDFRP